VQIRVTDTNDNAPYFSERIYSEQVCRTHPDTFGFYFVFPGSSLNKICLTQRLFFRDSSLMFFVDDAVKESIQRECPRMLSRPLW